MPKQAHRPHHFQTPVEIKKALLLFYQIVTSQNIYPSQKSLRRAGLHGGQNEINVAWDALAAEGLISPRKINKTRLVSLKNHKIKNESIKHRRGRTVSGLEENLHVRYSRLARAAVEIYGRARLIEQHKVIASWMLTKKPASRLDLSLDQPQPKC